jgi:L-alanine-DL-glutamate epimerase-like enolase superfamily enzyme
VAATEHQDGSREPDLTISAAEVQLIDFRPPTDPIQAASPIAKRHFVFVRLETDQGPGGTGFVSTVGTGGHAVAEHLKQDLTDRLIGQDAHRFEALWDDLFWATHGTVRGAITGLAMSAIDIAIWDLRGRALGVPLWTLAGGHSNRVPAYNAESGWLELSLAQLVEGAEEALEAGWSGIKIKVGKANPHEDRERAKAVRETIGPEINLMIDANQSMTRAEATRLAHLLEPLDIYWFEEPLPADDVAGHALLAQATSIPLAFGESLYTLTQFREYLSAGVTGFVQPDATRVGGVTPWLKIAHLAEAFNTKVAPHVRTELSVSLAAAVPNGAYVEQHSVLGSITTSQLEIIDGIAFAPAGPGIGIEWDEAKLAEMRLL